MDITAFAQGTVPNDPTTKWRRRLRNVGVFCMTLALISFGGSGVAGSVFLFVFGAAMFLPWASAKWQAIETRHEDLALATQLGTSLHSDQLPSPVSTPQLAAHHQVLEPGEVCYIDGAPATLYSFYGDPTVIRRGAILAFGSPLAWGVTIIGNLMFWSHGRKEQKKAAPRWRDPEPAQLWVTDRRLVLHGLKGNQAWVQLRYENLGFPLLEKNGVVLHLPELATPAKIRLRAPVTVYVLCRYLSLRQIFDVKLPWWSRKSVPAAV
jgi:hypothetical protein